MGMSEGLGQWTGAAFRQSVVRFAETWCSPSQPECHDAAVTVAIPVRFLVCSVSFIFLEMLFAAISLDLQSPRTFLICS